MGVALAEGQAPLTSGMKFTVKSPAHRLIGNAMSVEGIGQRGGLGAIAGSRQIGSRLFSDMVNKIFDQYLRTTQIPVFEYSISADKSILKYRYTNCVDGFNLSLFINSDLGVILLGPESNKWNTIPIKSGDVSFLKLDTVEKNYYLKVKEVF